MFKMKSNTMAWAVFAGCILLWCVGNILVSITKGEIVVDLLLGFIYLVPVLVLVAFIVAFAYLGYQELFMNFEVPGLGARQIAKEQAEALEREFEEKFDPMFYRSFR